MAKFMWAGILVGGFLLACAGIPSKVSSLAALDLHCPAGAIEIRETEPDHYLAVGCDREATYHCPTTGLNRCFRKQDEGGL